MHPASPAEILATWRRLDAELAVLKEREREAREAVVRVFFPQPKPGTNNFETEGGKLKFVNGTNYTIDKEAVWDALTKIRAIGSEGSFLADRLVTFDPKLSISEYKKLDETTITGRKVKKIIDVVITTKPAAPSLEFVEPKK